jgi:hypothetical protein
MQGLRFARFPAVPFTLEVTTRIRRSPFWTTDVLPPLPLQAEPKTLVMRSFPPPGIEESWRNLLEHVELPSHYAAPEFFREEHLQPRRPFAVLAVQRGAVAGVLTGMHGPNRTASGLASRAQICVDHPGNEEVIRALVAGLLAEAGSFDLIEIHSWTPLASAERLGFRVRNVEGPVVLDLTQPVEELFKQLERKRRNNIRFAIKNGLEFTEISSAEDFSAYYKDVYSHWRATSRKQIREAEATFEGFERRFRLNGNRKLFVARANGKTVAGAFLRFYPGGLVEYSANSSLDEYLRLKPNEFIQWRAIEWARSQAFRAYSMGGAGQFHREFGGTVVPEYHYWLDRTFLRNYTLKGNVRALSRRFLQAVSASIARSTRRKAK